MSITPTSIRDLNFRDILGRLCGLRVSVYEALLEHGPCTTRQLAEASGIDILTVRPRVTELYQLGLAVTVMPSDAEAPTPRESTYRALTAAEAEDLFRQRQAEAFDPQTQLPL